MIGRSFLELRDGLIERGLLCGNTLQLTPEGNAYVVTMMAGLRDAPPPPEPLRAPIVWDMRRERPRHAEPRK